MFLHTQEHADAEPHPRPSPKETGDRGPGRTSLHPGLLVFEDLTFPEFPPCSTPI